MTIEFPCLAAKLVDASKVIANDYNPNAVASPEMDLLEHSIREDGVTQPVVTFYDADADIYVVVDGFHRYTVLTKRLKCKQIPVVTIDKPIQDRMASTIRHNRARGKHKVDLMSDMVVKLLKLGWKDIDVANHLGMTAEEVLRLKQMTGLAGLFDGQPYSKAWESYEPAEM
jgi:ParB-like chromosome segregation protein Spo0J